MTRFKTLALLSAGIFAISGNAAHAEDVDMSYKLPELRVAGSYSQRILECPGTDGKVRIETLTGVTPSYVAGQRVPIDPTAGFLAKREVKLTLYENGTLQAFNAQSEGQGGALAAAAIKAAAFAVTAASGVPLAGLMGDDTAGLIEDDPDVPEERLSLACRAWVSENVAALARIEADIVKLEQLVMTGQSRPEVLQLLDQKQAGRDALKRSLTLEATPKVLDPGYARSARCTTIGPLDYSRWFTFSGLDVPNEVLRAVLKQGKVAGVDGYRMMLNARSAADCETGVASTPTADAAASLPASADRAVHYRVPMNARVVLEVRDKLACETGEDCASGREAERNTRTVRSVEVPQWGTLRSIAFDGSGIFGSKAVSAKFAPSGRPMELGYASGSGADAFAGVLDAGVSAATTIRDAPNAALQREVTRRDLEAKLKQAIEDSTADDDDGGNDGG